MTPTWHAWTAEFVSWGRKRVRRVAADGASRTLGVERLEDRVTPATPGGTTVAVGDLDGDGVRDVIAAGGPGLGAVVQAFSGRTGGPMFAGGTFNPYPGEDFTSVGLYVAAGDIDADGRDELFVSPDLGGGARVQVFSFAGGQLTRRANFFAIDDPNFRGGGRIAVADVNGDGRADLVAGAGVGGGPRVATYSGRGIAENGGAPPKLFGDFFAFEPTLRDGIYAAAGDLTGDGKADLIFGGGPGGGPRVLGLDAALLLGGQTDAALAAPVSNFFAGDPAGRNGVFVAAADLDADAGAEILSAGGTAGGNDLVASQPDGSRVTPAVARADGFTAADTGFRLAAADLTGDGVADAVVAAAGGPDRTVRAYDGATGAMLLMLPDPFAAAARFLPLPVPAVPPANTAPTVADVADVAATAGQAAGPIPVRVGDAETPAGDLVLAATSSDPAILPAAGIVVGGAGADRTITLTPAAGATGTATVTLTVRDAGGLTAADTFTLTVTAAPVPPAPPAGPTISDIPDQRVTAGRTLGPVTFTVADADTPADQLTVTAVASDPVLVPASGVVVGGTGADRTVTLATAAGRTGAVTVTVTVSDGVRTARDTFTLTVDPVPTEPGSRVTAVTPADGTELVSLTHETVVRFDAPVDPATVTPDAFYLVAQGAKIPGTIRVSPTGTTATFFQTAPLPESSQVRVVVDGSKLAAADGSAVDADGDGAAGGTATADFRTLPLTLIPNTRVFGYVYDSYAKTPDGADVPVVGATISLDANPAIRAVTDATGFFELGTQDDDGDGVADGLPAPDLFVHIDGGTAVNAPADSKYATLGKPFHTVPGQRRQLNMAGTPFNVYLPPMSMQDIVQLDPTRNAVVGFGPSVTGRMADLFPDLTPEQRELLSLTQVTYPAGSAMSADGTPATKAAVIPVNPARLPAPLPAGQDPKLVISIQAGTAAGFNLAGGSTNFDTPAPVTFPNLEGLAPGEQSLIWSFDHDAGKWVVIGNGTVTADGKAIASNPGVGVLAPGWHFTAAGATGDMPPDDDPCHCGNLGGDAFSALQQSTAEAFSLLSLAAGVVDQIDFGVAGPYLAALGGSLAAAPDPRAKLAGAALLAASRLGEVGDDALNFVSVGSNFLSDSLAAGQLAFGQSSQIQLALALQNLGLPPGSPVQATNDALSLGLSVDGALTQGQNALDALGQFGGNLADCISQKTGQAVDAARDRVNGVIDEIGQAVDAVRDGFRAVREGVKYITDLSEILNRRIPLPSLRQAPGGRVDPPTDAELIAALQATVASYQTTMTNLSARGVRSPGALLKLQSDRVHQDATTFDQVFDAGRTPISPGAYYTLTLADGTEQRGRLNAAGAASVTLPANATSAFSVFDPTSGRAGATAVRTAGNGSNTRFQVRLGDRGATDADGDGLPDLAETIIGTNRAVVDSDGDGIPDGAEIDQGTNPLDGVAFPTGTIASLPLPGDAQAVAVAGDLAFVATGDHGLAVVDAAAFDRPILLGQIDLPGTAVDVDYDPARKIAAVATGDTLELVDLADTMTPRVAQTVGFRADRVEVVNGLAYAAADNFIRAIDLSTGTAVQTVFLGGSGRVTGLARDGDTLYAYQSGDDNLFAIDVAREGQAAVRGKLTVFVSQSDVGLFAGNGVVTVAGGGLQTVNAADPANLVLISGADSNFSARRVALNGSGLALVAPDGGRTLELYSSADPQVTDGFLTRFDLTGPIRDVAVSRGIGFAAVGSRLEVVNYRPFDSQGQAPTVTVTASADDADAGTPGTQVVEGGAVFLRAAVTDDVQARSVEWLVNGVVAGVDVAFPFDFAAAAPAAAAGGTVTVQARATDTGGNVTTSAPVTLTVVPDTFPPAITFMDPADGGRRFEGQRFARVRFSEPLDPAGVTAATFAIVGAGPNGTFGDGDDVPVAADVQLRDGGRLVQLTVPAPGLPPGSYQVRIDQAAVRDRAGNPLGAAPLATGFSVIEFDRSAEFLPFGSDVSLRQDDNSFAISPMPFAFDFFGQPVSGGPVFVTTNGVVEFGRDTVRSSYSNRGLPYDGLVVMPFWDDLDPRYTGSIGLYDADGVRAITFQDVPYYSNTADTVSFQVAFFSNGQIQFRYGRVAPLHNGTATVGLSDGTHVAVPSLGAIQNDPDRAVTDPTGLLTPDGLAALSDDDQNDLLVFSPDGTGGYTIVRNPGR